MTKKMVRDDPDGMEGEGDAAVYRARETEKSESMMEVSNHDLHRHDGLLMANLDIPYDHVRP
ncbi:hypothetical protein Syun_012493 [Stephania yunnanensis]|uniref:Uncharacterized protein n=1 Tax=Stephania yunnanensis TaxID=152371 RepID=A0AAP0PFD2_9MAGN